MNYVTKRGYARQTIIVAFPQDIYERIKSMKENSGASLAAIVRECTIAQLEQAETAYGTAQKKGATSGKRWRPGHQNTEQ